MPENSGVVEVLALTSPGRLLFDVSCTALMPMLDQVPSLSSGRAVITLTVAPMPPVGVSARLVL
jgi:hypothetical protein